MTNVSNHLNYVYHIMNPSVEQTDDDNMAFSVSANAANAKAQKFHDFCHEVWVGVFVDRLFIVLSSIMNGLPM